MSKNLSNIEIKLGNGEEMNLKDFFDVYYPVLTSFASKYISNLTVCEDIVQEVLISFWEKKRSFPNIIAVKAFFYTSIRNSCLDFIKHSKVEDRYRIQNGMNDEVSESFLEEVIRKETYSKIYQEINRLPEMGKKVLLLALHDKSNEEIAEILNIGINTVKTHKARAYKVLRRNLYDLFLFFMTYRDRYRHK